MPRTLTATLCALLLFSGCYTRTTRIPGVLDLRTDAADEVSVTHPPSTAERTGAGRFFLGRGTYNQDGHIHVEDRSYWALGFFPVYNVDSVERLETALQAGGVLSNVTLEERVTWMDAALYAFKLVPVMNLVMCWATPSITFEAHATPLRAPPLEAP